MIVRISGVVIPSNKRIEIALTYVFGIGRTKSQKILAKANIEPTTRTKDLKEDEVNSLRQIVEKEEIVEGDLKREVMGNIKRLKEIGAYRGSRHSKNLPTRGQRTKTDNRTVRGNTRRTAGSGKKNADQKT